jgi:hypothetical protein
MAAAAASGSSTREPAAGHAVADDLLVEAVDGLVGHPRELPEGGDPGRVLDQVQVQQVELAVLLGTDEGGVDQGGEHLAGVAGGRGPRSARGPSAW